MSHSSANRSCCLVVGLHHNAGVHCIEPHPADGTYANLWADSTCCDTNNKPSANLDADISLCAARHSA